MSAVCCVCPVLFANTHLITPALMSFRFALRIKPSVFFASVSLAQTTDSESGAAELEAIVMSGNPLGRSLFEQAQPVSILEGESLKLRLQPTLGETLSGLPRGQLKRPCPRS